MLIITSVLITLTALVVLISGSRVRNIHTAKLGWMSAQWLAEHRAARST